MSASFSAWWGNPFTATLLTVALFVLLWLVLAGLVAVVRLGGIQLRGLLSEREELLPRYPRHGDAYAALVLFIVVIVGMVSAVGAVSLTRATRLTGLSTGVALLLLVVGWVLALLIALATSRSARLDAVAVATLATLRPFTPALRLLSRAESAPEPEGEDKDEAVDDHDVQAFIGAGEEAGILEREDAELIASIVDLSETVTREIMTPRTDVVALPVTAEFAAVEQTFASSMFSRIPVYRETLDRIEGVIHVMDVLRATAAGTKPRAGELMRPVLAVPETKPLRELLREFQRERQQLTVVVDEYGGTSGIVTLEDVLEEIVGEIQDEHQREASEVEPQPDGSFVVLGSAHVEVLEDLFGVEVGETEFDSVAGLVLDRLGRLPRPGEKIALQGIELEAVEVDRRRLRRVRVRRTGEAE